MDYKTMDASSDQLIFLYFHFGLNYREILQFLATKHGIVLSLTHLKRKLKCLKLYRRKMYSNLLDVAEFIQQQQNISGQLHGYRWMHLLCIQNGFTVQKEVVRMLMKIIDPIGVDKRMKKKLRRREYNIKGPNYLWHVDSYDKLKPFGFCINGCIDGYSRKIMWLHVSISSNDPRVIAGYYVQAIISKNGVPKKVRGDLGTENSYISEMQTFLRRGNLQEQENAFLYGTSQHNQRIESWWSILRKECTEFWISLFQKFKMDGIYCGDFIDKNLMQFCFMDLLKTELQQVEDVWNAHRIRPLKENGVSGRPILLYNLPELKDTVDYIQPVNQRDIEACLDECVFPEYICDKDVYIVAHNFMSEHHIYPPQDVYDASNLYVILRDFFRRILDD